MMHYIDPESGYILPVPSYIDSETGLAKQTLTPESGDIPMDGRTVSESEWPRLFGLLREAGMITAEDTEFKISDTRVRVIYDEGGDPTWVA